MFGREIRSADSFRQASSYHSILFHRKLLHRNEGMHEKPEGPFKLLKDQAYNAARRLANNANRSLHRADPSLCNKEIHEIKPVKFGGSPTDPSNKTALSPADHDILSNWWGAIQRAVSGQ
jgi:hypothetical protein